METLEKVLPETPKIQMVEYFNEHWYKINLLNPPEYFPSTTTKLGIIDKPFLAKWRGEIGNREADYRMKEAAQKGSNIHNGWDVMTTGGAVIYQNKRNPQFTKEEIEDLYSSYLGNLAVIYEQDEQIDLWKLQEWHKRLEPEYLHSEIVLYSITHKEAGTCDKVIRVLKDGFYDINGSSKLFLNAGVYVADLKTGKVVDDTSFMQISDYREMAIEMGLFKREDFSGGLIVHTGAKTRSGIKGLATILRTTEELDQDYIDYRHASDLWLRKHKNDRPDIFEFPAVITIPKKENTDVINI